jgi:hypothetical protein
MGAIQSWSRRRKGGGPKRQQRKRKRNGNHRSWPTSSFAVNESALGGAKKIQAQIGSDAGD